MPYPRKEEEQVRWWVNQLDFSRKRMKPLVDAHKVIARQFYNLPTSEREQELEGSSLSGEMHLNRTRCSIIYGWIDQTISNMIDRNPVFKCYPETPEAAAKIDPADPHSLTLAEGTSRIVNYRYRETNQLRVDERVVQDAFLSPFGVAKIGYTVDFDKRFQELVVAPQDGQMVLDNPEEENMFLQIGQDTAVTEEQDHRLHVTVHLQLLQGGMVGSVAAGMQSAVAATVEDHIRLHRAYLQRRAPSSNSNVKYEAPYAIWWPSDMFLTDVFSTEGPQDARWIAFGWELPIEEVQADPNYENTRDLKPGRWHGAPEKEDKDESDGLDVVRGWEIWAKNFPVGRGKFENRLFVVAEDHDRFLRNEDEWPYTNLDDYPAEVLVFNQGLRTWYHKSPLLMGGGDTVQGLVNEILDSYLNIVRRQKNVWLVDPSSGLTTEIIQDILEAPDCSVVEVPGLIDAKGHAVVPLPLPQVPEEKGNLLAVIQQMFDRSMGTPQPMALPKVDSATEASIMEKRNTSRENRRSGLLSEFQSRKARKMWQLDTQFRPEKSFLIDKNAPLFLTITEEIARGEYMFTMDVTSHSTSQSVERSQWMDLLNLFAGMTPVMIQSFGLAPNLPELARRLLVRGFGEKAVEEILPMLEAASRKAAEEQQAQLAAAQPQAAGAQEAVQEGRQQGRQTGPLKPDVFNRDLPKEGNTAGAQESVR